MGEHDNAMSELKIGLKTSETAIARLKETLEEQAAQHTTEKSLHENEKNIEIKKMEITISELQVEI